MTMQGFIHLHRLTMKAERTDDNPNMDGSADMDHWKLTLSCDNDNGPRQRRRMTLVYSMGRGHKGAQPQLGDVLDTLASDANSVEEDFENWCQSLGFDDDSRKARKTYNACVYAAARLKKFLGDDAYEQLVEVGRD